LSIKFINSLVFDIYLKKEILDDVNFKDKDIMEKYLKNLFKKIKEKYDITIEGFYDIDIYIDKYYGVILHLEKEDLDYYECFRNQVDMRITLQNINFLYLVEDIPKDILNKVKIEVKNNNIYLKIIKPLNNLEMMKLLENSKIVYGVV